MSKPVGLSSRIGLSGKMAMSIGSDRRAVMGISSFPLPRHREQGGKFGLPLQKGA